MTIIKIKMCAVIRLKIIDDIYDGSSFTTMYFYLSLVLDQETDMPSFLSSNYVCFQNIRFYITCPDYW